MHQHLPRVAGLVAILAALLLAPTAQAASTSKSSGANAKERTYGKHCGKKSKQASRARTRAKCLDAMAKLGSGDSTSPRKACRALSKTRATGERRSAFARCVTEGARVLNAAKRGDYADDGSEADDEEADDDAGLDGGDSGDDLDFPLDEGDGDDLDSYASGSTTDDRTL